MDEKEKLFNFGYDSVVKKEEFVALYNNQIHDNLNHSFSVWKKQGHLILTW